MRSTLTLNRRLITKINITYRGQIPCLSRMELNLGIILTYLAPFDYRFVLIRLERNLFQTKRYGQTKRPIGLSKPNLAPSILARAGQMASIRKRFAVIRSWTKSLNINLGVVFLAQEVRNLGMDIPLYKYQMCGDLAKILQLNKPQYPS